jgi:hypothetical protein
MYDGHSDLK